MVRDYEAPLHSKVQASLLKGMTSAWLGYSRLKDDSSASLRRALPPAARTKKAARRPPEDKGTPHVPFDEFSVKELDRLVAELEKTKPPGTTVEVSTMEESHHSPCMQEMQSIVVQSVDAEGQPVQTYFMYQFCPNCQIAVRVL